MVFFSKGCGRLEHSKHNSIQLVRLLGLSVGLFLFSQGALACNPRAVALLGGSVLLEVEGSRKLVKSGEVFQGVEVLEANSRLAKVVACGKPLELTLSRGGGTPVARNNQVSLRLNDAYQYIGSGRINGQPVKMLVDTGANVLAINKPMAMELGIDLNNAQKVNIQTASGNATGYAVTLNSVSLGDIEVYQVEAVISDNHFPKTPLLGMSFLRHLDVSERGGVLTLEKN